MFVYRIVTSNRAQGLQATGIPGRWNRSGTFVIYASNSRSLACLENLVHRSASELSFHFRCMVIEIPDYIKIEMARIKKLEIDLFTPEHYAACQTMGYDWAISRRSAVLKVPSAIIPKEYNFMIHAEHPDFKSIRLKETEEFYFDPRLKLHHKS